MKLRVYSELLVLVFDLLAIVIFIVKLFSLLKIKNYMLHISLVNLFLVITIVTLTILYIYLRLDNLRKQNEQSNDNEIIARFLNYRINHVGLTENGEAMENKNLTKYFTDNEINVLVKHGFLNLGLR